MPSRLCLTIALLLGTALSAPSWLAAQAKPAKPVVPTIRITVDVHDSKGVAVPGAGVVLRQVFVKQGKLGKDPFNVELHTDSKGQIVIQGFVPGIVLVQVIAKGYETYGQNFVMTKADETVHVALKPPRSQVSTVH